MWSNKGKGVQENHLQNNSCTRTTAGISIASFSPTEQVLVACSHFHNCPIYLSQLFSPQIPFSLGSQLKKSACVVKDIILVQDFWVEKIVWLDWNAEISTLELLRKWSWPFSLSFFVLPSSCASHQGVRPSQKKMSASERTVQNPHVSSQQRLLQN